MSRVSTNDLKARHPYTTYQFWANEDNWFWESDSYTESSKMDLRASVGYPAQREKRKLNKSDFIKKG